MEPEMTLAEAEALVAKNLPEWEDTASSNFAGFAELLVDDYRDWAIDTLAERVQDEDKEEQALEAWKLVAARYFKAMCRPVPSFKTADGVTCYVGELVYCKDGKRHEVTDVCLNGEIVYVSDGEGSAPTEAAMVTFYEPEPPRSLKEVREEQQAERKQAEAEEQAAYSKSVFREMAEALNDRGAFHERLLRELTDFNGYIGIKEPGIVNCWEEFLDTDGGAEAVEWWESRDVRFKVNDVKNNGVVLYVEGVEPSLWYCTMLNRKSFYEHRELLR